MAHHGWAGRCVRRRAALGLAVRAGLAATGVALLAACGGAPGATPGGAPAPSAKSEGPPRRGDMLRVAVQNDFVTMWPLITTGPSPNACYDWLVAWRQGADGKWGPRPSLAESWELGERQATFKLRKGVKFHDGSDFNAEVAQWNVDQMMKHPRSIARTVLEGVDPDKPAEVVDEFTLRVNLKGPLGSLLAVLSDGQQETAMVSRAAHERLGDDGLARQAVGSGPFTFDKWVPGSQLSLNRWDKYWQTGADGKPLPYLDRVVYRFIPDDSVRALEMQAGNSDLTDLVRAADIARLKADPKLTFVDAPSNGNRYRFVFNAAKPPFKDNLKLRQAVQFAVDRVAIARALGMGSGIPLKYDLIPGQLGYDDSAPHYSYDPERAKQLVKEAGYANGLEILLTVISREADQQQAQMLQQQLGAIGIKATIEALERTAWGKKVRVGNDFQMATQRTGVSLDPDAGLSVAWASEGPAAYSRAKIPEMDRALAAARFSYDPAVRQQHYRECLQIMYDTAWWGFIWMQPWNYVHARRLKGFPPVWAEQYQEAGLWLER